MVRFTASGRGVSGPGLRCIPCTFLEPGLPRLELVAGLEPATYGLQSRLSSHLNCTSVVKVCVDALTMA